MTLIRVCCFHYTEIEMCALLTCQPTGHQLQEGAEGVEDPGAEEVDDLGTHDAGQVGLKTQWLKTTQGLMTQRLKTKNRGQPPILCRF